MAGYFSRLGSAATRFLNALTGGDPAYSFSARCGAAKARGAAWAHVACALVDALLRSHNHCDEQAREAGLIR